MAADLLFPMYEILVETIFGSVALAVIGVAAVLALILALCRTSWIFIIQWEIFYAVVMMTLWLKGFGIAIMFVITLMYFIVQLIRFWAPER